MMGRRQKLSGWEWDAVSKWRRILCSMQRAGARAWGKAQMNRRERRESKRAVREDAAA